jgi:hypothetical protein
MAHLHLQQLPLQLLHLLPRLLRLLLLLLVELRRARPLLLLLLGTGCRRLLQQLLLPGRHCIGCRHCSSPWGR